MKFIYTGVGSRETPKDVIDEFIVIGETLSRKGYCLRSGGADGADLAFEKGCDLANGSKQIFIPWKHFNKSDSPLYYQSMDAFDIAAELHPAWDKLSDGVRKIMARNVHQVLGLKLDDPSDFLVCWTKHGDKVGGTAMAIRVAELYKVPVYNYGNEADIQRLYREIL